MSNNAHRFTEAQMVTQEMHIYAQPWPCYRHNPNNEPWYFDLCPWGPLTMGESPDSERIYIGKTFVSFRIPGGVDLLTKAVETLEEAKATIRAEATMKCKKIDERIQSLMLIEHKPEVA